MHSKRNDHWGIEFIRIELRCSFSANIISRYRLPTEWADVLISLGFFFLIVFKKKFKRWRNIIFNFYVWVCVCLDVDIQENPRTKSPRKCILVPKCLWILSKELNKLASDIFWMILLKCLRVAKANKQTFQYICYKFWKKL